MLEGSIDGVAIETAVKEAPIWVLVNPLGTVVESLSDAVDGVVSGGSAEEEWGACRAYSHTASAAWRWGSVTMGLQSRAA